MTSKTSLLRTDGFITNVDSCHPYDVIRADVVLARLEEQAARRCGLFYEIFQSQLLGTALDYLARLPLKDRPVLIGAAAKRGYMLTLAEEKLAQVDYDILMSQLAEED